MPVELPGLGRLRVRVSRNGSGEPVLLIMGLGGGLDMWRPLVDELDGVETLAVDAPGVGASTTPLRPLAMVELADLYARLVRALGFSSVHVVGFSFGGAVAQQLASSHPSVVRSLVLAGTGPGLGGVPGEPLALAELWTPWRYYSPSRFRWIAPVLYGGRLARDPQAVRGHERQRMHAGPSVVGYAWQLAALAGWSSLPWLHRIEAPTLVLTGDEDPVFPLANARMLAAGIRGAELAVVRGGGHLFVLDSAAEVAPLLRSFLQRTTARASAPDPPPSDAAPGSPPPTDVLAGPSAPHTGSPMPTAPASGIVTRNPATEQELERYQEFTDDQVDAAVDAAVAAQQRWARLPCTDRSEVVRAVADVLRRRKDEFAALIAAEMGKPVVQAEAEIEKCAWTCEYFAAEGERYLADQSVPTGEAQTTFVTFEPLGVVLAVEPWNFPFWQVIRFAAPALVAGNAAVLKHSPNVTGCALALEEVFVQAGAPAGLLTALLLTDARTPEVTARLIDDPRIAAVTLTGSERAGVAVGAAAGRALKKSVLELGGSDPFIVLSDADVEQAAVQATRARYLNSGQSCIAAKRFIVEASVADEFEQRLVEAVAELSIGDPTERSTEIGPLARGDLRDALERQVAGSVELGATVACGGRRPDRRGYYYEPTVLTGVTKEMPAFAEETFGPVATVTRVADEQEAVELANASPYGLGASVWTRDPERARRVGRQVQSQSLFVNALVASDPRLPFGGTKRSGYGRELAAYGIREFVNVRTWWMAPAAAPDAVPTSLPPND